jgi:hypothetical protein
VKRPTCRCPCPQSRVGFGPRPRGVRNCVAQHPGQRFQIFRLEKYKFKVQVIRHTKSESFAPDVVVREILLWGQPPSAVRSSEARGFFWHRRQTEPPRCDTVSDIREAQLYNQGGGGNSSTGRAPDCGSDGCGFDSRFPPQSFSSSITSQSDPLTLPLG